MLLINHTETQFLFCFYNYTENLQSLSLVLWPTASGLITIFSGEEALLGYPLRFFYLFLLLSLLCVIYIRYNKIPYRPIMWHISFNIYYRYYASP